MRAGRIALAPLSVRMWFPWSGTTFYHSMRVVSVVVIRLTGRAVDRASQSWNRNILAAEPNPGLVVMFHIPVRCNGL